MKKPLKILSSATIATLMASTAIVPVAAASENVPAQKVEQVVFNGESGELLSLEFADFSRAFAAGALKEYDLAYVKGNNGEFYKFTDFSRAYAANEDLKETFKILFEKKAQNIEGLKEGKVQDSKVVGKDEQPEDRLNETFFYNVA